MSKKPKPPKVRIAKPSSRPWQLRYRDPETNKEVRITTATRDDEEAEELKRQLEAKLLLGIDAKPKRRKGCASMSWDEFRERYTELQLSTLRDKTVAAAESRLDIAERILKPRRLSDVADSEALHELQAKLLRGDEGHGRPRAKYTVRNYMAAVVAALNWASTMGWLSSVPKLKKIKVAKLKHMKGRPLTRAEVKAMLKAVRRVVGSEAAPSWRYLLRTILYSGFRLEEVMNLHWSDRRFIVPEWSDGRQPVLVIPADKQKNETEEAIPMLPAFERLLLSAQEFERFGWVVNPMSLQTKLGRRVRHQRPDAEWVGRIVSRIGEAAKIVVEPAKGNRKEKFASSHDLRRTCAERLISAGVPEREVSRVMRHASAETTRKHYAPGTVQQSAKLIRKALTVPRYSREVEST